MNQTQTQEQIRIANEVINELKLKPFTVTRQRLIRRLETRLARMRSEVEN